MDEERLIGLVNALADKVEALSYGFNQLEKKVNSLSEEVKKTKRAISLIDYRLSSLPPSLFTFEPSRAKDPSQEKGFSRNLVVNERLINDKEGLLSEAKEIPAFRSKYRRRLDSLKERFKGIAFDPNGKGSVKIATEACTRSVYLFGVECINHQGNAPLRNIIIATLEAEGYVKIGRGTVGGCDTIIITPTAKLLED